MKRSNKKILMIFIEPTPYILDLLEYGFADYKDQIDIIFLSENLTQQWNLKSDSIHFQITSSKKQLLHSLCDIFLKRKYQLVHIAGWSRPITLFLIIASRFFFLPVVVETDTPLNPDTPVWKRIIKKIIYPVLFKFPLFFLPGGMRQAYYLNHYGVKNNKIINAQMTVDVSRIKKYVNEILPSQREQLRLKNNAFGDDLIFLYVGRLLDWKGIRELMSSIQLIQNKRAKLWIVGSGELANEIILAAQSCDQITYFGRVGGDLLWHIYHAADVFVLPSHFEPWGLVVNEAMAAEKPLIVSETVGCVGDLVSDYQNGLLIQPKNVSSLRDAMNFMLENPEKRKLMAKNSLKYISSWTLQNEADNIVEAWGKVCR